MKRFGKIFTIVLVVLMISCVSLLAGCKKDEEGGKATASPTVKATATATASPTATAAPTTAPATASPTATGSASANLLDFAIADDPMLIGGDVWTAVDGVWAGTLQEKRLDCENVALQEFVEETLSDGTEGTCYHFYSDSTIGFHIVGNTFGVSDILKENTNYKLTVSLKYVAPDPGGARDDMYVYCNAEDGSSPQIKVPSSDKWQKITYLFKTKADVEGAFIMVGPNDRDINGMLLGEIDAGFDLLIESISLEVVG